MTTKIKRIRCIRAIEQQGRCYYCGHMTWSRRPNEFAFIHGMSIRSAKHFQQTAEHLHPLSAGGSNDVTNVVMACLFCNSRRHRCRVPLAPQAFKAKVQTRIQSGRWHGRRPR